MVLIIAIVAANFFHQGSWQRVWSARSDPTLVDASLGAALLTLPVVIVLGVAGMVAAGAEGIENPSLAFFALAQGLPSGALVPVVALAVSLVASTVDTLQNGLVDLVAEDVGGRRLSLATPRWLTVLLTIPAMAIALQGFSVLRLFLIADLLAAATIVPVVLGLWHRARPGAALVVGLAGLGAVVVLGWVTWAAWRKGSGSSPCPRSSIWGHSWRPRWRPAC